MARLLYYLIGVPVVMCSLLYTSLIRRFFYFIPITFFKLMGAFTSGGFRSFVTRVAVCSVLLVLGLGNHFVGHAYSTYLMYINEIGALWQKGQDHIESLSGLTMSQFEFGGTAITLGLRVPSEHVALGLLLFALSIALARLIDIRLK
ncbi:MULTISPECIES: hypothetical protein [Vibrio]|uniref:hypothetical protein n=1 Tax=Vibrio TaxID=662 RepID=UPI0020760564|nr:MULTISPECIES: hypothetical protein [Vibrio]USD35489.1 hypothetical protein J8Z27_22990 [Vibrio sp. SCSIO 43186]USD72613.1 hypothetical protein J4N41_22995 [Vibrio sp. SCSIO 43139]USD99004.1 hypothetical protein CTT30_23305 [Vibrio coralliilyticus]